jgi:hypothetical protein
MQPRSATIALANAGRVTTVASLPHHRQRALSAFFVTPDQRDAKLTETFNLFQRRPKVIAAHVARSR